MDSPESTTTASSSVLRPQVSLLAVMGAVTSVAVFLGFYCWLGKDGLLPAALIVPAVAVPILAKRPWTHKVRMTAAAMLLTLGVTWSALFPKTRDVLRPDTFASILIGVGLVGGGLLFSWRSKRFGLMLLCSLLLWSVLLNLLMFNQFRCLIPTIKRIEAQINMPRPATAPPSGPSQSIAMQAATGGQGEALAIPSPASPNGVEPKLQDAPDAGNQ